MLLAIEKRENDVVVSIAEELLQRNEFSLAFEKLSDDQIKSVFEFVVKKIKNSKFSELCTLIAETLLELYPTTQIEPFIEALREVINQEIDV